MTDSVTEDSGLCGWAGGFSQVIEIVISQDVFERDIELAKGLGLHVGHFFEVIQLCAFDGVAEIPDLLDGQIERAKIFKGGGEAPPGFGGDALLEVGDDPDAVKYLRSDGLKNSRNHALR